MIQTLCRLDSIVAATRFWGCVVRLFQQPQPDPEVRMLTRSMWLAAAQNNAPHCWRGGGNPPEALSLETVEIFETYRPVSLGIGYRGRLLPLVCASAGAVVKQARGAASPLPESKPDDEGTGDEYDFRTEERFFSFHVAVPPSRQYTTAQ